VVASAVDQAARRWSNSTVRAVVLRVAASLRHGWRASAVVALVVAVASGAVLALAAGARRVSTAPDRYAAEFGGDLDALVIQPQGMPRLAEVAGLPAVEDTSFLTFFGADVGANREVNTFVGTGPGAGRRVVAGRPADPGQREEFVANPGFVAAFDAEVGDHFPVRAYTQEQVSSNDFDAVPGGPAFEGVLVGIIDSPDELDDPTPTAVFSPALLDDGIGVVTSFVAVKLRAGATRDDLRAQLDSLPDGTDFALDAGAVVSRTVRNAVSAQAQGLWAITAVAALAAVAALGQVLSRHGRVSELDRERLVALGTRRRELVGEAVGRALVPATTGVLLGAIVAVLASDLFPFGFVRQIEPHQGIHADLVLLVPAVAVVLAAVLGWVAVTAWLDHRTRVSERPSSVVEQVASRAPTASAAAGVRFAFVRNDRGSGSVAGTLTGLTLAIVGVVGAVAFASSVRHLVGDGDNYGSNFDIAFGNGWLPAQTDLKAALDGDEDVDAMMLLAAGAARAGPTTVELVAAEATRGGLFPHVLEGRAPGARDEMALGRVTAEQLGVGVGDELTLEGDGSAAAFRIVGLTVLPSLGPNSGVGVGGLLTFEGVHRLDPTIEATMAAVVLRPGAPSTAVERLGQVAFSPPGNAIVPSAIVNVDRVKGVPGLLAGLLGLLALIVLAHTLIQSVRARRYDLAILRALGADRRSVGRTVHWQATALTIIPLVLGIPLGLLVGRLVFTAFVDRIGAVPEAVTPVLLVVLVAVGVLAVANVVGAVPAARARSVAPAAALRVE
jgi:hypothetical protein